MSEYLHLHSVVLPFLFVQIFLSSQYLLVFLSFSKLDNSGVCVSVCVCVCFVRYSVWPNSQMFTWGENVIFRKKGEEHVENTSFQSVRRIFVSFCWFPGRNTSPWPRILQHFVYSLASLPYPNLRLFSSQSQVSPRSASRQVQEDESVVNIGLNNGRAGQLKTCELGG